jgi:hypothetical protein
MSTLDWCGLAAMAAIVLAFWWIRRLPAYIAASSAIVGVFAVMPYMSIDVVRPVDWWVMTVGLLAFAFGLLIVRVMLIRSVSLLLLGRLDQPSSDLFRHDIRGRLDDMRRFGLVRNADRGYTLT